MKSTIPKLGQCARCKAYVFTCLVDGLDTVVDSSPLGVEDYRACVIQGRPTFDLVQDSKGTPSKLKTRTQFSSWGKHVSLAQHPCGLVTVREIEVAPDPKAPASVSFSSVKKAFVPVYSRATPDRPAKNVIHAHIETDHERFARWRPAICCVCDVFFTDQEKKEGLYMGYYISSSQWWAVHSEGCPKPPARRGGIKVGKRFRLDGTG